MPFHKLTQWLCYSLVEAIESTAGWTVATGVNGLNGGKEPSQTGLPEYRNGGLLMDLGLTELRLDTLPKEATEGKVPKLEAGHPAVVEWRAITVMTLYANHTTSCVSEMEEGVADVVVTSFMNGSAPSSASPLTS